VNGHFAELISNRDLNSVDDIKSIWADLYLESIPYGRKGIAIMALSGVDLALWDLLGKAEKDPVHKLIGMKTKDRIRTYATGTDVEWYKETGFTAHKFPHRWNSEKDYQSAFDASENAREIMGYEALIMIDTYMSWNADVTIKMSEILQEHAIYWFEDVTTPDELESQSVLRKKVKPTLIAGGEHEFTHHGFNELARNKSLDLWQPDITWCGGITSALQIMDIAARENIPVIPHRGGEPWGLHFITSTQCENLAEILPGSKDDPQDDLWIGEKMTQNGYISPGDESGFGVIPNPDLLP
jgi:L-alanine-DL-glutamate epimerase-like enolase superfamily enzyme